MIATPTFAFAGVMGSALWVVRGKTNVLGINGSDIVFQAALLTFAGPNELSAVSFANQPLPDTIQNELMTIKWQVSFDHEKSWIDLSVGTSKNWLYVTGGPARGAFETVLWLGCGGANGQRSRDLGDPPETASANDKGVADAVFGPFSGARTKDVEGDTLTYWGQHTNQHQAEQADFFTAAGLLKNHDGRCGAWTDLLMQCLTTQGVQTATKLTVNPSFPALRNGSIISEELQVDHRAQGDPDVQSVPRQFDNHVFVIIKTMTSAGPNTSWDYEILDPSYGVRFDNNLSTIAAVLAWQQPMLSSMIYNMRGGGTISAAPPQNRLVLTW